MSLDSLKARLTQKASGLTEIKEVTEVQGRKSDFLMPKSLMQHPHPDDMRPLAFFDQHATLRNVAQQVATTQQTGGEVQQTGGEVGLSTLDSTNEPSLKFYTAPDTHTPVCVLLGPGGTGKTFRIQRYQEENPNERVILTATTGVAAINIGPTACTINSTMRFFNEQSLRDNLTKPGIVQRIWTDLAGATLLVIDEVSMLSSGLLELIYEFIEVINRRMQGSKMQPIKLLLSGDFCQLPPVVASGPGEQTGPIPFAFHARQWEKVFEPSVVKLRKNYRQANDPDFQRALHACRVGDAAGAAAALRCNYVKAINYDFKGLTLYAVNKEVETHNTRKLRELPTDPIMDTPQTWGDQLKDWKEIPNPLLLKINAQVRVTANCKSADGGFEYVNGDIGVLEDFGPGNHAVVKLNRGSTVTVDAVTRMNLRALEKDEKEPENCNGWEVPSYWKGHDKYQIEAYIEAQTMKGRVWFHPKERKWVIGEIKYVPIMLGWASTFHRAQGITVPTIQIDIRPHFSGSPQMMYVALSRCTSASGIYIARGDSKKLASRIAVHSEVAKYV